LWMLIGVGWSLFADVSKPYFGPVIKGQGPICCSETSVTNYQTMSCYISKEERHLTIMSIEPPMLKLQEDITPNKRHRLL
jgi:hypothetical protein